jgi:sugar O-acyltransferase (sialic acid O-acetyltransferase NeuD family)
VKRLAVLGASGHGGVVADAALASGWQEVVFFDARWPDLAALGPWAVAGDGARLIATRAEFDGVVVAIGANRVRLERFRTLAAMGAIMVTILHPSATVSRFASVGAGSVLCAGAIVNPFANIGTAAIINTAATVDHDCHLADGVHVSPGAHLGGSVTVGEASWIGIGATVRQGITIGSDVVVGAGASVISTIGDAITVAGVPAKTLNGGIRT